MITNNFLKISAWFILLISTIVLSSFFSNKIWGTKSEKLQIPDTLIFKAEMTVNEFGQVNNLTNPMLKQIFNLQSKSDLGKKVSDYGNNDRISALVTKNLALISEKGSKNWTKIIVKFIFWVSFLCFVFQFLKNKKLHSSLRKRIYLSSILIFGIILGSDPSPMGTVKDAIYLLGTAKTIFPPRMIALAVFLILVILANKYICSWGCQAGVLQDFLFRLNQKNYNPVVWKRVKLPFAFTNSVRITFFVLIVLFAFGWGTDIIEPIDLFKIYNPVHLGIVGGVFAVSVLVLSLFIYRPWCHMICPFGLIGWIFEKLSLVKIVVDYDSCIACKKCAKACPSTVMSAILLRNKKTIPDCFSCYTCRDVCPTNSIKFSTKKRSKPPKGHFDKI